MSNKNKNTRISESEEDFNKMVYGVEDFSSTVTDEPNESKNNSNTTDNNTNNSTNVSIVEEFNTLTKGGNSNFYY